MTTDLNYIQVTTQQSILSGIITPAIVHLLLEFDAI